MKVRNEGEQANGRPDRTRKPFNGLEAARLIYGRDNEELLNGSSGNDVNALLLEAGELAARIAGIVSVHYPEEIRAAFKRGRAMLGSDPTPGDGGGRQA